MNKKEITEIKKLFTKENAVLTHICGCYVDGEGEQKSTFKEAFLSIPDEEQFKYLELFKKSLSGAVGKSLFPLDFSLETEQREGGFHSLLLRLRASGLEDDGILDEFYGQMRDCLNMEGNYLILLGHGLYDVPGKSSDGSELFDASEDVFEHLLCCICPVTLTKPGLCYDEEADAFRNRSLVWAVNPPSTAFLFPAFTDRGADIHQALLYVKSEKQCQADLLDRLFGVPVPVFAETQKEAFTTLVETSLGENCSFSAVTAIQDELAELCGTAAQSGMAASLSCSDMEGLLLGHGAEPSAMEGFTDRYEGAACSNSPLTVSNLIDKDKVEIRTDEAVVRTSAERAGLLETKVIGGRTFLMVPMDGEVTVGGIRVRMKS